MKADKTRKIPKECTTVYYSKYGSFRLNDEIKSLRQEKTINIKISYSSNLILSKKYLIFNLVS